MSARARVLVVDDDHAFRFAMRKALRRLDFEIVEASSGEEALPHLRSDEPPAAALLDLRMKGMDGLEVLRKRGSSPTRIVVLTGHGSVEAAVEAMQLGAFSFLEKPVDADVLGPLLRQAIADGERAREAGDDDTPRLIGDSPPMREVRKFIETVAPTDETVTAFGETGTGKEVVARAIHATSTRSDGPFVAMNAACVPGELFESELFGHERGAFTGATADRLGLFREARGGTLFIDELGELPIDLQPKLLRALETRRIRPVGESKEVDVDVRIVAATNRDLWEQVQEGRFREDLYFRLQVFPVRLPPLRERREDILPLTEHLLHRVGAPQLTLDAGAEKALVAYDWPGNVRELQNAIEYATVMGSGKVLTAADLPPEIRGDEPGARAVTVPDSGVSDAHADLSPEGRRLVNALERNGGHMGRAAASLGISRTTLWRRLKRLGIDREEL